MDKYFAFILNGTHWSASILTMAFYMDIYILSIAFTSLYTGETIYLFLNNSIFLGLYSKLTNNVRTLK